MIRIPNEQKQFKQSNSTDRFGNIYRTKNISFDKKGYITVSEPTRMVATSADLANLQTSTGVGVAGSVIARGEVWIFADKGIYKSDIASGVFPTFSQNNEPGAPVFGANSGAGALNWDGNLHIASGSAIRAWSGVSWATFNSFGADFLDSFTDRNLIAAADGDTVNVYDRAGNLIQTLTINDDLSITGIKWNNSRLYIATRTTLEGSQQCLLIEWDSLANTASNQHWIDAKVIMSITPYEQGVAFVTNEGMLGYCYGGVQELDHFPVYNSNNKWQVVENLVFKGTRVATNGMYTDNGKIYIGAFSAIDSSVEDNTEYFNPLFPSGVWCFDKEVGLHHKYSVGQSKCVISNAIATTDVDTSTDIITIAGVTVPETGTPCFYKSSAFFSGTVIGGLGNGIRYFTIKISDSTMKVATSRSNALAGTAIDLTGTGNADQRISFHPENDFGGVANQITSVAKLTDGNARYLGSWMLDKFGIGAAQQTGTQTSVTDATFSVTQKYLENRGWLITPKLESFMLEDNYATIALKWNKLKTEDQKIIIKYKTRDSDLDEFLTFNTPYFTLTANDTLTTTQDLSGVEVGDEIEFVRGAGAGYLAHVTSISEDAGTYTVEFDEEIRNFTANERGWAVFTKWKKLQVITKDDEDNDMGYRAIRLAEKSKWAMFKIELRGWDTSISDILIDNKPQKPVSI